MTSLRFTTLLPAVVLASLAPSCVDSRPVSSTCDPITATDPSLPGVTIHLEGDSCRMNVGEGGTFTYSVTLDAPITFTREAETGCSSGRVDDVPGLTGATVSGASTDGASQFYCVCDTGCGAPRPAETVTLPAGTTPGTLDWPGVNWTGPSDYGAPYGADFPPGTYDVKVTFGVPGKGSVVATLPITVQ